MKSDPVMAGLARSLDVTRYQVRPDHFRGLVGSIISQQLSTKAAAAIRERFIKVLGSKKYSHKHILKASSEDLRAAGLSGSKVRYIIGLAEASASKALDLKKIQSMEDEAVIESLTAHKGVGRWTAEMFLMFYLGRPDVFSLGDGGLRNAVTRLYKLKSPTPGRIMRIAENWKPYRSAASLYLWTSLDNE